jgi:hypothetical protein
MKRLISTLTIALMFVVTISKAQITNPSFETWDNMGTYTNPNGWGTMNNTTSLVSIYTAEMGTPGSPGTSYLKLTSKTTPAGVVNGIAVCGKLDSMTMQPVSGLAYTQRPTSFNGKWQHMISGSSQGSVTVTLTKWNTSTSMRDVVGTATQTLSGMAMSWANFTIPFTYAMPDMPDSCIIVLKASGSAPTNGDYLWVDNLSFTVVPAGINEKELEVFTVYPNPVSNMLSINSSYSIDKVIISDMNGKMVSAISNTGIKSVSVTDLASGNYSIQLFTKSNLVSKGTFTKK